MIFLGELFYFFNKIYCCPLVSFVVYFSINIKSIFNKIIYNFSFQIFFTLR